MQRYVWKLCHRLGCSSKIRTCFQWFCAPSWCYLTWLFNMQGSTDSNVDSSDSDSMNAFARFRAPNEVRNEGQEAGACSITWLSIWVLSNVSTELDRLAIYLEGTGHNDPGVKQRNEYISSTEFWSCKVMFDYGCLQFWMTSPIDVTRGLICKNAISCHRWQPTKVQVIQTPAFKIV